MGLFSNFLGGTNSEGIDATREDNARRQQFIEDSQRQARADVLGIAPAAEYNRNLGFQSALDVFGQTMPQQLGTFQQGNIGAQEALIAGMPQFRNAIMGMPVDYSQFQPRAIQYDSSYTQQQLPEFINTAALLGGLAPGGSSSNSGAPAELPGGLGGGGTGTAPGQQAGLSGGQQSGFGPGYTGGFSPQGGGTTGGWFGSPLGPGDMNRSSGPLDIIGNQGQTYGANSYLPIGSETELHLSENAGRYGALAGLLTGIPGMRMFGNWLGDRNMQNNTWMNPLDPNDPYARAFSSSSVNNPNSYITEGGWDQPTLDELFNPDAGLPMSPAGPGRYQASIGGPGGYGNSIDRGYGFATRLRARPESKRG